jgi:hypothetical protein
MTRLIPLLAVLAVACQPALAQRQQPADLNTLLRDASYVLNRYEEVTTGLDSQIDGWSISASTKQSVKGELAATLRAVEAEKPSLNALLGKSRIRSSELFDAYNIVSLVASDLEGASSSFGSWGDTTVAVELAQLGSKASILGTDIGGVLRSQIADRESQLDACSRLVKAPSHK